MSLVSVTPPDTREGEQHWTARHGKPIIFVILTLVAVGIYLALTIPIAVFPDTNFPRIVIGVDNGVAPIDQMQVTVTRPLEEAVNTVQGLDTIWSITSRRMAEIDLLFNWNVDMYRTLELVKATVSRVQTSLPSTAKLTVNRLTFAAFPIMGYSLTSDVLPQTQLWELANYEMKPRLNRQPGVSSVVVQGGQQPEFEVQADPSKLIETATTVPNILDAIGRSNLIDSPGLIEMQHQLVLSLVSGQARTPDEISRIVVKTAPNGSLVHIGDIAKVTPSVMPVYTVVTANGKPAVLLNVFRQPDSNTVEVASAVRSEIAEIRKSLPKSIQMQPFYDQSEIVTDSIKSVRDAILIGLILASLIMVLFLRDWGTSLVAGLVIPATIAVTFVVLKGLHQTFNLMTLGGLAAAVGLVIDDAIVVVENIVMHRDSGQSRAEAIRSAIREIRVPLVGSTLTPIVVFVPLISIAGVTGTFFRALAITVATALLTSLALALTWTPTLSHYLLRRRPSEHPSETADLRGHVSRTGFMGAVTRAYDRALRFVLRYPVALAAGCVVLIAASFLCYKSLDSDLLPAMDEGGFILDYLMPAGSSLQDTNQVLLGVEKILQSTPEVATTSRRTGLQLGLATVTEANTGDFSVRLKRDRSRGIEEIIADVRARINKRYPQLDVEFPQLLQDMIGDLQGSPEPIEIKLFSPDPALLAEWAPKVCDRIKKIDFVKDVKNGIENTISGPAIVMSVDPVVAARAGFTPQEIEMDASAILQGEPATNPVVVNDRSYTIRVRFPQDTRATLDDIRNTVITSSSTGKT